MLMKAQNCNTHEIIHSIFIFNYSSPTNSSLRVNFQGTTRLYGAQRIQNTLPLGKHDTYLHLSAQGGYGGDGGKGGIQFPPLFLPHWSFY